MAHNRTPDRRIFLSDISKLSLLGMLSTSAKSAPFTAALAKQAAKNGLLAGPSPVPDTKRGNDHVDYE